LHCWNRNWRLLRRRQPSSAAPARIPFSALLAAHRPGRRVVTRRSPSSHRRRHRPRGAKPVFVDIDPHTTTWIRRGSRCGPPHARHQAVCRSSLRRRGRHGTDHASRGATAGASSATRPRPSARNTRAAASPRSPTSTASASSTRPRRMARRLLTPPTPSGAALRIGVHGMAVRYYTTCGINSRLDTLQAAVLRIKLRISTNGPRPARPMPAATQVARPGTPQVSLRSSRLPDAHVFNSSSCRSARDALREHLRRTAWQREQSTTRLPCIPGLFSAIGLQEGFPVSDRPPQVLACGLSRPCAGRHRVRCRLPRSSTDSRSFTTARSVVSGAARPLLQSRSVNASPHQADSAIAREPGSRRGMSGCCAASRIPALRLVQASTTAARWPHVLVPNA